MGVQTVTSEWTGVKGRIGAWYLGSPLRRASELLVLGNLRPRFLDLLGLKGDETVVDAGCGSGFYSLAVARRPPRGRVICIDLSDEMLDCLARRVAREGLAARVEIRRGDATSLALSDDVADVAVSNGVWHELPEPLAAARELFRVLRSGGRVVVTDFRDTALGTRIGLAHRKGDHGPFSVDALRGVLQEAGFEDVQGQPLRHWAIVSGVKRV